MFKRLRPIVNPGCFETRKKSKKKAGKDFGLISNPEFLQETTSIRDTKFPHAVVLGGYNTKYMKKAKSFFSKLHPNTPIILTNHQTAEMVKYANNSFLATKISFINQLSNICQNIPEANVDDVAKTIGLDPRIGKLFLNAGPGYGGSCLPKDMKALINFADRIGVKPTFLNEVEKTNQKPSNQLKYWNQSKLKLLKVPARIHLFLAGPWLPDYEPATTLGPQDKIAGCRVHRAKPKNRPRTNSRMKQTQTQWSNKTKAKNLTKKNKLKRNDAKLHQMHQKSLDSLRHPLNK